MKRKRKIANERETREKSKSEWDIGRKRVKKIEKILIKARIIFYADPDPYFYINTFF